MTVWKHLKRPPWRTFVLLFGVLGVLGLAYLIWSPGARISDGRHDRRSNGIWLQHGWLGDQSWFDNYDRDPAVFRNDEAIDRLSYQLAAHGIRDVFPHVCPCLYDGTISPIDAVQAERFLDGFGAFRVIPWIGGVYEEHCHPDSADWRAKFIGSSVRMIASHPRLAGVHINIEPMPSGNPDFLVLLDEFRAALPEGKILSVAAYPPPTRWHPYPEVHWDEAYFREVAQRCDQIVPMMYDTSLRLPKVYTRLMDDWTREVVEWSGDTEVLLGLPAYDDDGVGYHSPRVENLETALSGVNAALESYGALPDHYAGVAIYSEWEMDAAKWEVFRAQFERRD
jgi:hypothetical protein